MKKIKKAKLDLMEIPFSVESTSGRSRVFLDANENFEIVVLDENGKLLNFHLDVEVYPSETKMQIRTF